MNCDGAKMPPDKVTAIPETPTETPTLNPDLGPKHTSELGPWTFTFLENLRKSGNVSFAAREAGQPRNFVYSHRRRDVDFCADWEDALEEAADRLELEALRRAVEGTSEARFFGGDMVGSVQRYSDNLLMFLLKARRPWQFDPQFRGKIPAPEEADQAWLLLQIGLGGYVVGRSVEKISPHKKTASLPPTPEMATEPSIHGNSSNAPAKAPKKTPSKAPKR
jgi:hypothetical protein